MKPFFRAVSLAFTVVCATAAAEPAPTPGVIPAKANEPAQTIGPLPAAPAVAPAVDDDLTRDPVAPPAGSAADGAEPESMVGTLWKMFLALGIVVALVYVTLNYGLRKMMGVRGAMLGRSSLVKVVERIPLDPKRTLFVIEAAGEYLLVGGADANLNLISKLSQDEVKNVLAQRQAAASKPSPFLQKLLSRPAVSGAPAPTASDPGAPAVRRTEES